MKGYYKIHARADCNDCDWKYKNNFENSTNLLGKECQKHVDETGHEVVAELGFHKSFTRRD